MLRDLLHAAPEAIEQERARVSEEGWGARLLALQKDGQWDGGACFPNADWRAADREPGQPWTSTLPVLQLLCELGVDPKSPRVQQAIAGVRAHCHWEHAGQPFFSGEVEPCINGRTVRLGVYFGQDVRAIVERLLAEQLDDGGWNCEAERGSVRSSFDTTINVLEGLLAYEQAMDSAAAVVHDARKRGEAYLLERSLFRRKSTGEIVNPAWLQFSFPPQWHYDVLRALDYFRFTAEPPDPRIGEAVEIVRSKQQPDGRWLLENTHPGRVAFPLEEGDGKPSRWNTLRALRVLAWHRDR